MLDTPEVSQARARMQGGCCWQGGQRGGRAHTHARAPSHPSTATFIPPARPLPRDPTPHPMRARGVVFCAGGPAGALADGGGVRQGAGRSEHRPLRVRCPLSGRSGLYRAVSVPLVASARPALCAPNHHAHHPPITPTTTLTSHHPDQLPHPLAPLRPRRSDEIATCSERAYTSLPLGDAQRMLMLGSEGELLAYAKQVCVGCVCVNVCACGCVLGVWGGGGGRGGTGRQEHEARKECNR